jgi:hypothetical protein
MISKVVEDLHCSEVTVALYLYNIEASWRNKCDDKNFSYDHVGVAIF